jgi:hypothetical protein
MAKTKDDWKKANRIFKNYWRKFNLKQLQTLQNDNLNIGEKPKCPENRQHEK